MRRRHAAHRAGQVRGHRRDNDADDKLEVGETWQWTCKHVVTLTEATDSDGTDLWNKAHVDGKDDVGRTVFAEDTFKVVIKVPDVTGGQDP